jgi:hypothetical protein
LDYQFDAFLVPIYDSTPVDSFSGGATSALVARKIKMASQQYQDSLKMAFQKEADLKKQKALEEKMKKEIIEIFQAIEVDKIVFLIKNLLEYK